MFILKDSSFIVPKKIVCVLLMDINNIIIITININIRQCVIITTLSDNPCKHYHSM